MPTFTMYRTKIVVIEEKCEVEAENYFAAMAKRESRDATLWNPTGYSRENVDDSEFVIYQNDIPRWELSWPDHPDWTEYFRGSRDRLVNEELPRYNPKHPIEFKQVPVDTGIPFRRY